MALASIYKLPVLEPGQHPTLVLVGNGINRPFDGASWQELIENSLARNNSSYTYSEIERLPATMQIVAACGTQGVNHEMNELAKDYREQMKNRCKTSSSHF